MKTYRYFFKFILLPAASLIALYACGNLKDFSEDIEYKQVIVKNNGIIDVSEGIRLTDNNFGVDLIAFYAPNQKSQSADSFAFTSKGSVKFELNYDNTSPLSLSDNSIKNNLSINPTSQDENLFRQYEDFLLQNIPKIPDKKGTTFKSLKSNEFKKGDTKGWKTLYNTGSFQETALITSICVAVTEEAYIFSEAGLQTDDKAIEKYAEKFEAIYKSVHENFGRENDIDGNGKIIILIYDMKESSTLGYFYSADKFPKSQIPASNEADIFYINSRFAYDPSYQETVISTLAHEFQHMIYFDTKYNKIQSGESSWKEYNGDSWLNEGLSMLSEHYAGYEINVSNWIASFLQGGYRGLSLTYWSSSNYGYSGLFTMYLDEKTGYNLAKKIYNSNTGGIKAVEIALNKDFNEIFFDFLQTIYLSNKQKNEYSDYSLTSIDLSKYQFISEKPDNNNEKSLSLKPYGFDFIATSKNTSKLFLSKNLKGYAFIK